jgi:alpha-1,6-mannosyltransferase
MSKAPTKGAAGHLYWSNQPSNKPPEALTTEAAKALKADAQKSEKVWTPIYKWGQRKDKVILTIFVPCLEEDAVSVDLQPRSLRFRAERVAAFAGNKKEQREYTLSLELSAEVDADRKEIFLRHDHVRVELPKVQRKPWRTLQPANVPKNPNERPDFDLVDEDSDDDDEVLCRPVPSSGRAKSTSRSPSSAWWKGIKAILPGVWEVPLFVLAYAYIAACPLNKVEESFGLQATHDLLYHRTDIAAYDHHAFPGVVPRTFLGPLALAASSSPIVGLLSLFGQPKLASLYVARAVLATASCAGLVRVARAARRQFGTDAYKALLLLSCTQASAAPLLAPSRPTYETLGTGFPSLRLPRPSPLLHPSLTPPPVARTADPCSPPRQFHWLFYCSRTLPNTFASLLVLVATSHWVDARPTPTLRLLTAAAVICRAELILLLAPLSLLFLVNRQILFTDLVLTGVKAAAVSLALSVAVDSFFWRRPLYPEGEVLYFNTVLNKSGDYGTSPFHWYFTSALPRAMGVALPLALLAPFLVPRSRALVCIPAFFVLVYSILPHKELRFVLYALPPLNVAAAACVAKLRRSLPPVSSPRLPSRLLGLCGRLALLGALLLSATASGVFLAASRSNYPGGRALEALHALVDSHASAPTRGGAPGRPLGRSRPIHVHIGVDAAMSGVSRFLERPHPWRYSKAEGLAASDYRQFAYALVGMGTELEGFSQIHVEEGFDRVLLQPPFLAYAPKIRVLRRKKEGTGSRDDYRDL